MQIKHKTISGHLGHVSLFHVFWPKVSEASPIGYILYNLHDLASPKQESPADTRVHHSKMAVSRHLGCYRTGNSAMWSAEPENPCLEPDMEWIGCTVSKIFAFKPYCALETGVRVIEGHRMRRHSVDPENLTLEWNITSIGKTVAKLWPFLYI